MNHSRIAVISSVLLVIFTAQAWAQPTSTKATMSEPTQRTTQSTGRIPLPDPKDMTPEELAKYQSSPANQLNISRLLSLAKTMMPGFQAMNEGMATGVTIPPHEREIVTLAVLHLERGEYEWAQHLEVAKFMGIPQAKVDAIAKERFGDSVFTDRERALLAFTRQVVKAVRVDDATFNAVASFYNPRQIVETVFAIGNYMMLARLTEVAELPIDSVAGADFWKNRKPAK